MNIVKPVLLVAQLLASFNLYAADITSGRIDTFEDGTPMGWHRGPLSGDVPKVVSDAGNQYLKVLSFGQQEGERDPDSKLSFFNSTSWVGNYTNQGIITIKAHMINLGTTPLHMRIRFGDTAMLTMYASNNAVVLPPDGQWREVSFGITAEHVTGLDFGGGGAPGEGGAGADDGEGGADAPAGVIPLDKILANVGHVFFLSAEGSLAPNKIKATFGIDNIHASTSPPSPTMVLSTPPPAVTPITPGTPSVQTITSPRALSGLWYDPALDGSGFNLVYTQGGLLALYYGYSQAGERLWLISSNIITDPIKFGEPITLNMVQGGSGTYNAPAPSSQLTNWGTLQIQFNDSCTTGTGTGSATLSGTDGSKAMTLTHLAGVKGLNCMDTAKRTEKTIASANVISGLWFDPAFEGSGFNLVHTAGGLLALYYGYSSDGQKLWLISSNIVAEPLSFDSDIVFNMSQGGNGTFDVPTPPADLIAWGSLTLQFDSSCKAGAATLDGLDGTQVANLTLLAGIKGLNCGN